MRAIAIVTLLVVLTAAIAVGIYYMAFKGSSGGYLYEIEENGINPGTKGPFPDKAPYVAPPTTPPPSSK